MVILGVEVDIAATLPPHEDRRGVLIRSHACIAAGSIVSLDLVESPEFARCS